MFARHELRDDRRIDRLIAGAALVLALRVLPLDPDTLALWLARDLHLNLHGSLVGNQHERPARDSRDGPALAVSVPERQPRQRRLTGVRHEVAVNGLPVTGAIDGSGIRARKRGLRLPSCDG